jgi:DNA repair protein RadA/Sms
MVLTAIVSCYKHVTTGVGKSTLLLQTAFHMASSSRTVWYISGEETAIQIASRAQRLGLFQPKDRIQMYKNDSPKTNVTLSNLWIFTETNMDRIVETLEQSLSNNPPALLLVDSIQTMICPSVSSSFTGSIAQVRECVSIFLQLAKSTNIPIFLIGHVTKQGDVAGPKTVEHLVDAVLYLEQSDPVLILRAVKNRFGSIHQVGMYQRCLDEDSPGLLEPVSDPSQLFLQDIDRRKDVQGCAVSLVMEGPRAFAMEIQALVSSPGSSWTRTTCIVQGISQARVYLIIALLSKLYHIQLGKYDIYVNIVGGFDRSRGGNKGSSALDLAVAVALMSSLYQIPVRADTAFVGEVGLLGELRPVMDMDKRFAEAVRMGFSRIISPKVHRPRHNRDNRNFDYAKAAPAGLEHVQADNVKDAVQAGLVQPIRTVNRNGKIAIPSVGRLWKRGSKRSFKRDENWEEDTDGEEIYT